jgi:hypothetical protein
VSTRAQINVTQNEREAERLPFFQNGKIIAWLQQLVVLSLLLSHPIPLLVNAYTNKKNKATLIDPESFAPLSCWCWNIVYLASWYGPCLG